MDKVTPASFPDYLEANRDQLIVPVAPLETLLEELLDRGAVEVADLLLKENLKALAPLKKRLAKAKREATEEEEKRIMEENAQKAIWEGVPEITKKHWKKVAGMEAMDRHRLFGTHEIPCSHNVIFHFICSPDSSEGPQKTTEYSRVKCRNKTNNYVQTIYNEKTGRLTIIMPDRAYLTALAGSFPVTFLPVDHHRVGQKKEPHACILAFYQGGAYYFEPNGQGSPENRFMDSCFSEIFKNDFTYVPIAQWNRQQKYHQMPPELREPFNKGDCTILTLLFALYAKDSPEAGIARLDALDDKARKVALNELYLKLGAGKGSRK